MTDESFDQAAFVRKARAARFAEYPPEKRAELLASDDHVEYLLGLDVDTLHERDWLRQRADEEARYGPAMAAAIREDEQRCFNAEISGRDDGFEEAWLTHVEEQDEGERYLEQLRAAEPGRAADPVDSGIADGEQWIAAESLIPLSASPGVSRATFTGMREII